MGERGLQPLSYRLVRFVTPFDVVVRIDVITAVIVCALFVIVEFVIEGPVRFVLVRSVSLVVLA